MTIMPLVVSSVVSTYITTLILGTQPAFVIPQYMLVSSFELLNYAFLGLAAGVLSVAFIHLVYLVEDFFHKIKIPPMVHLKEAGIYCSAWLPIFVSFFTGWLAGILGIGGGLIRMPALIYMIGCPTHVAVGTDLFEVAISGLYGAATYTWKGRTELVAAMIMLVGAAMGAQVGAVATKYIKGYGIRIAFGLAVIGCAVSILLKLVQPWLPAYKDLLNSASTVLVLGLVSCMSIYIFVRMVQGVKMELAAKNRKN